MYDSRFVRIAGKIADFGHPFYAEERQRDIWNAASAFGLQATIWLTLLAAPIMVWVGGWTALPYALASFVIISIGSWLTVAYARRLGVGLAVQLGAGRTALKASFRRGRMVLLAIAYALFLAGVVRAAWPRLSGAPHGFLGGFLVGAALGIAGTVAGVVRQYRRDARLEERAEQAELAELSRLDEMDAAGGGS